jgi:hypothetical protein
LPPSSLRITPTAEIATHSRCAFVGSTTIECRHNPPAPGIHRGRVGCFVSPFTSVHVSPSSRLTNSAASSTPAYHVPGSAGCPGTICQMCFSSAFAPFANFGSRFTPRHVFPPSSVMRIVGPCIKCPVPARMRPPRESPHALKISQPPRCGPLNAPVFRVASSS